MKEINGVKLLVVEVPKGVKLNRISLNKWLISISQTEYKTGYLTRLPDLQPTQHYELMPQGDEEFVKSIYPDAEIWQKTNVCGVYRFESWKSAKQRIYTELGAKNTQFLCC